MKKRFKFKKMIIALVVIAVLVCVGVFASLGQAVIGKADQVSLGNVEKYISEAGTIESLTGVTVSSKATGQIASITVAEGDTVQKGQVIMTYVKGSSSADIGSIQAQLSGLKAQYSQAKDLANKNKDLYDQGAISYEEYNQADTDAKSLSAEISSLQYSIQSISESSAAGGVTAPENGTVTAVFAHEGETITAGAPILEICDLANIIVKVNLVTEDANLVSEGSAVRVFSDGTNLIDDKASIQKIYVKAQEVLSELGIYQKRVPVEIKSGETSNMRLGSDVDVEIIIEKKEQVLRVPENAVFELSGGSYVFAVINDKAMLTKVETGLVGEDYIEITKGLAEHDIVILSPSNEISDGVKVKIEQ